MRHWILGIALTPLSGSVQFCSWYLSFFGEAMRGNDDIAAMKEVQNLVMYAPGPGAKFPDALFQQIAMGRLRSCPISASIWILTRHL